MRTLVSLLVWTIVGMAGLAGLSLAALGIATLIRPAEVVTVEHTIEAPAPVVETCWSGTLAVQMPEYPDMWWVNYGGQTNSQVQICGVDLRVGDIQAFPDYSAVIASLSDQLGQWRDCALDGPPLCPKEYYKLKEN